MKSQFYKITISFIFILALGGCDDYLDQTPDAEVTENDIFSTFEDFQGFIEPMYSFIIDYNSHVLTTSMNIGGEIIGFQGWSSGDRARRGDYLAWISDNATLQSNFWSTENNKVGNTDSGIWVDGWRGIRIANLAIRNLDLLTDATQEERNLIEGQAYFFRAWFHFEMGRYFGGLPYVDQYLLPADDLQLPRLTWHEMAEKIVVDLDRAAELLPTDWDDTSVGGQFQGANAGRVTKGAALGFKAKTLLYAGSPLMNFYSGGSKTFDQAYMERAADAAWEVIQLANQGVYALVPFEDYQSNFATNDGRMPWTTETIFQKVKNDVGDGQQNNRHGRLFNPPRFGGNGIQETPNQLYVDRFEMADGTRYIAPDYDTDEDRRWNNRDPRFRQNILVDQDKAGFADGTTMELYEGGQDKDHVGTLTPYIIRKFWSPGANRIDQEWNQFRYVTPHLRLAEIYLIYAEAVNEAFGAGSSAPGASLSAVDAVNIVRSRAGMPDVSASPAGYADFRELLWNERFVELCFEGQWFTDIRRWYVAHLPAYKDYVDLKFDQDYTFFNRVKIAERVFDDPRHYWMPIPQSQTQLYLEFPQNPGW